MSLVEGLDSNQILQQLLDLYDLDDPTGELEAWLLGQEQAGTHPDLIAELLVFQPVFQERFAILFGDDARTDLSPFDVINYEQDLLEYAQRVGFPISELGGERELAFEFLSNNVSIAEAEDRIVDAFGDFIDSPQTVRDELFRQNPSLTNGQMALFFADPDRGQTEIERALSAARIGVQAIQADFGQLTAAEAAQIAEQNLDPSSVGQNFAALAQRRELFQALPGENLGDFTRSQQIGTVIGTATDVEELDRRARTRAAVGQQRGGFSRTRDRVTGLT